MTIAEKNPVFREDCLNTGAFTYDCLWPTYFGPMSMAVKSDKRGREVNICIDPPDRNPPAAIELHVPPCLRGRRVTDGGMDAGVSGGKLALPVGLEHIDVLMSRTT